jgi:hypothetical protein
VSGTPTHADLLAAIDGLASLLVDQLPPGMPQAAPGLVYVVAVPMQRLGHQMRMELRTSPGRIELRMMLNAETIWTRFLTYGSPG